LTSVWLVICRDMHISAYMFQLESLPSVHATSAVMLSPADLPALQEWPD